MSAVFGAVLWLAAPWVHTAASPSLGSIEHTFLLVPLVAAPLALRLLSGLLGPGRGAAASAHRAALAAQPVAAAMLLASFLVPKGARAGALAGGWLAVATLLALSGAGRSLRARARGNVAWVSLLAAHVFLAVGAAWLLLSRLGVAPANLGAAKVLLAAVHFHFSGFTLQVLFAASGLLLRDRASWRTALHRGLAIATAAAIPLIAAGNLAGVPPVRFLGVAVMVVSTVALAVTSAVVARDVPARAPRLLLLVSAASIAAAMILAGVYGAGELTGHRWIGIPRMAAIHGLLNAVGFTVCGLLAHLRLRSAGGGA